MTWTPAPPPSAAWAKDTTTPSSWSPTLEGNTNWTVRSTGSTPRITQDGRVRITETGAVISAGGIIRIIERHTFKWTIPLASPDLWQPT